MNNDIRIIYRSKVLDITGVDIANREDQRSGGTGSWRIIETMVDERHPFYSRTDIPFPIIADPNLRPSRNMSVVRGALIWMAGMIVLGLVRPYWMLWGLGITAIFGALALVIGACIPTEGDTRCK